jgi:hypothetical protein
MQLNVEELLNKTDVLRKEIVEYAASVQEDINKLQQDLQAKVREAQRTVDQKQGQLSALEDLIKEMGGAPTPAFPAPENN